MTRVQGGSTDVILKYLICILFGQWYPPKSLVKSAILGKKGHSLEASKRIWSSLICYSHFSGVYTALFLSQHAASKVGEILHNRSPFILFRDFLLKSDPRIIG